jgi:DNA-binding winged helix-turn-helix (wHTH) protein
VRRIVSVLGLTIVVAGIPAVLVGFVGSPFPQQWPSMEQLRTALAEGWSPNESFVLGVLAVLAWILWAQLLRHVAVELAAHRRASHRVTIQSGVTSATSRRGVVGPRVARWLVSGLFAAGPALPSTALAAEPPRIPVVLTETRAFSPLLDAAAPMPVSGSSVGESETPAPSYVVRTWDERRDCLWTIAERLLDDPMRWPELLELNADVVQPSGRRLVDDPRHWVFPGMELRLPADAAVSPETPQAPVNRPSEAARAGATTNATTPPPDPAREPSPAPPAPRAGAPTPAVTTPTTAAPVVAPIPTPAPSSTTTSTSAPPGDRGAPQLVGTPPVPDPTAPRPTPRTVSTEPPRRHENRPTPTGKGRGEQGGVLDELPIPMGSQGLLGAALLGAGVVSVLKLRRGVQLRHRRPGTRIPLAEEELASAELALRAGADADGAAFVDAALRALARAVQTEGLREPRILGVQLGPRELEVVLGEPMAPAPAPFVARAGGKRWTLVRPSDPRDLEELEDLTAEVPAPLPALVTLGTEETSGSRVLYDLEAPGLTCLTGDTDVAREVLYAAAAELATSSYGEYYSLVLVGFGEGLASLERVRVVPSLGEVIDDLERDATDVGQLLAESELGSTVEGRLRGVGVDSWAPTVVLCARVPPTRLARRLAALGTHPDNAAVAILVAGDVKGATTRLEIDGDQLDVGPMETTVASQRLSRDEAAAVGELLELVVDDDTAGPDALASDPEAEAHELELSAVADESAGPDTLESDREPGAQEPADEELQDEGPASGADAELWITEGSKFFPTGAPAVVEPEVMVRVLGPVDIVRGEERVSIERGKSVELVVYLATHREGLVDTDVVMEALWPGKARNNKTLNTTTTTARTALGKDSEGLLYLPRISGGGDRLYRISKRVRLDYEVFMELVAAAASQEPRDAIVTLRRALALVRGRPFEVLGGYEWAHVGLATRVAEDVADAAHRMARLCLAAHDPEGARWAAHQGLLASQGNEVLFCDRMDAEKLSGNLAGVRAIMDELHAVAGAEEPYGGIHPDTVAHFKELTAAGR